GALAVVREQELAELRIVRLTGAAVGEMFTIALPGEPSDVDLSPDGARAYAVLRDASMLAVIDVPGGGLDAGGLELVDLGGELVGSLTLSDDGARGLLFTNAATSERITAIELAQPGYPRATFPLKKSVRRVAFDPSGDKAL